MMTIGFTDTVTELRARSMLLATEAAATIYGFKVNARGLDKFMETFFDPVLEYMSAPGAKVGDTLLSREAALRSAITLYSAPGVTPPEMPKLFELAKQVSHLVMPELPGIEESEDKRLTTRFLPQSMQK